MPTPGGQVEPSAAAQAAIAALTAASVPQPLPGSVSVEADTYRIDGDCAQAIARYLAPDAPVPNGATIQQLGESVLVVLPYATSGVLFSAGDEYCQYRINNAPTVSIEGTLAGLPSGEWYGSILCGEESETTELVVMADLAVDGAPTVLVITATGAGPVPGSMADIFAAGGPPPLPFDVSVVEPGPERFDFELTGDAGAARVTGSCTGSVYQFFGTL